ncbi:MAG: hypothetical protein COV26_00965 [Candidatus Nealsonbacteria bacterium CG10_big_fil_rev_8_21_14_0_10_36_23]|uniref:Uncharacterized protein n=1 Tax=Candidatus Nealsonbacteria bacterium CG10_big_fil_rev_8_21_14_0_10_36_23 TaxID=1974709 RepID=A0A2H0TN58_9BACT|nr:MAG: hypothetical protein COV26_00965 [Candidatus Nealsonbacteria bacterium CG10_big_fil_rev_8_21_14_0_10_36_23]
MANFIIVSEKPNVVKILFGTVEEITSRIVGAERTNVAKVVLWGPDVLHCHKEAEETYICLEGEGDICLDNEIFDFVPGTRVIIGPGTLHAARPKETCERLILLCVSSPAFDPKDVYEDPRGRTW